MTPVVSSTETDGTPSSLRSDRHPSTSRRSTVQPMLRGLLRATLLCFAGCTCVPENASPPFSHPGSGTAGTFTPASDAGSLGAGTGDGGPCPMGCADDLRSRVDCNGVVTACAAGLGCTPAGCIDACAAAVSGGSTLGCEFFVAPVPPQSETTGSCYAAFVANTWNAPVQISVKRAGQALEVSRFARIPRSLPGGLAYEALPPGGLPPGEMAILFLSEWTPGGPDGGPLFRTPCPSPAALNQDLQLDGTGFTSSFEITASAPVVAYDIYPYGGADSHVTSASLLMPTSAWGTNYVGVTPAPALANTFFPYLQLYGQEDGTHVAVAAPVRIRGGPLVAPADAGVVARYQLNRGQVLQLLQPEELSGALVRSDKPIAVWGGHACMQVPLGVQACDSAHQQLPSVPLLSNEYLGARYPERGTPGTDRTSRWRLVGAVEGTQLSWQPPVTGAPRALTPGQTVEFEAPGPFRVASQDLAHVFYASQLMLGGQGNGGTGDPDFVNLVPPQQFLRSYLFFTDPTYARTDLVFIRGKGADGRYADVTLDCAAVIGSWTAIGTTGFQTASFSWTRDATGCRNGVHQAHSRVPFGLTVWGTDQYTSYGWPAGMGVRALNGVVVGPQVD